jgi:hypothetical protein
VGAGIVISALVLAVSGCSHVLPLGPTASPASHHLATAIVLEAVLGQPASAAGNCPSDTAALPKAVVPTPGGAQCYRQLGKPLTITSAGITLDKQPPGPKGQPVGYAVIATLPAAGKAGVTAVTTTAYRAKGQVAIIVAGKTWAVLVALQPITQGNIEIPAPSKNMAFQLQRMLVPSG